MLRRSFICVEVLLLFAAACRVVNAADIPQRGTLQIGASKIVGGVATTVNEYPWQVGLVSPTGISPFCGGSIISDQYIITAAHCVAGSAPSSLCVVIGEHNTLNNNDIGEPAEHHKISVARIVMHPNYSSNSIDNDIALVSTELPINYGGQPVAYLDLPRIGETFTGNSKCYRIERESNQVFNSTIMLDAECKRIFPKMNLDNTKICTVNGPSGDCSADYYYELSCIRSNSGTRVLVAIEGGKSRWCTQKPYRTVNVNMATFRNWIRTVTGW